MSIYSGFATRQQEHKYNSLLETLVIALKKRIIKFYNQQETDEEKFKLLVKKIYKKMFILEQGKFMAPKYTSCFTDLIQQLSIDINYDTMSECSSIASNITFRKDIHPSHDYLQTFNALKSKVNDLEKQQEERRQQSALSVPRKQKYFRLSVQNQQDEERRGKRMAESMYQAEEKGAHRKIFRGPLVDLKQLRGTSHMPKWEDFAPKRSQIFPVSPRRSKNNLQQNGKMRSKDKIQHPFRRQKYVKLNFRIQDI